MENGGQLNRRADVVGAGFGRLKGVGGSGVGRADGCGFGVAAVAGSQICGWPSIGQTPVDGSRRKWEGPLRVDSNPATIHLNHLRRLH